MGSRVRVPTRPRRNNSPSVTKGFCALKCFGLVVQLVRIHACHAWGRGFESRPDRLILTENLNVVVLFRYRSEGHTSELQSRENLVCRLLLDKKKTETVKY